MNNKESINAQVGSAVKEASYKILQKLDKNSEKASEVNRSLLMTIVRDNQDTEFGRSHSFNEITNPDTYREKVSITTYDDYADDISKMMEKGDKNLITAYPVNYYATTSGTTGAYKCIPVSDRGLNCFREYAATIAYSIISEFYKTTRQADIPNGYLLTFLNIFQKNLNNDSKIGCISATSLDENVLNVAQYLFATPKDVFFTEGITNPKYLYAFFGLSERNIIRLTGPYIPIIYDFVNYLRDEWPKLVNDIRMGQFNPDIEIPKDLIEKLQAELKPNPERADELEKEFSKGFDSTIFKRIWPNLSSVEAIWAGNFSSYTRKIQEYTGRSLPFYTAAYSSSEGVFAVARHPYDQYYVMVPDSCFFEFIPVNEQNPEYQSSNPKTILIDEVQEGKDYELVITNQSGFYRYRMGDVIRVVGFYNESPMIIFKYRVKNIISIVGEHFTEDNLFSAIKEFERRTDINVIDYCMYPNRDITPVCYTIMIETDESISQELCKKYTEILQQELCRSSQSYADYYGDGIMGMPKLVFLQSQTFQLYREMKMYKAGISENQLKPIHVLTTPEQIKFFTALENIDNSPR